MGLVFDLLGGTCTRHGSRCSCHLWGPPLELARVGDHTAQRLARLGSTLRTMRPCNLPPLWAREVRSASREGEQAVAGRRVQLNTAPGILELRSGVGTNGRADYGSRWRILAGSFHVSTLCWVLLGQPSQTGHWVCVAPGGETRGLLVAGHCGQLSCGNSAQWRNSVARGRFVVRVPFGTRGLLLSARENW